jgi:hypothetical protein
MKKSRRKRLDEKLVRKWLKNHAPKQVSKPHQKPQRLERWQILRQQQKRERQALAKPLLKGVWAGDRIKAQVMYEQ